jgi:hypothetical protein
MAQHCFTIRVGMTTEGGAKGKGDEEKASGPRKMELSLNVGVQFGLTMSFPTLR